jgi:hypothetical protein
VGKGALDMSCQQQITGPRFRGTRHTLGTQESHNSQQTEALLVSDSQSAVVEPFQIL